MKTNDKYLTDEQENAFRKLKRMKVYKIMNDDYRLSEWKSYFDFIWWYVLHEYDMFIEGECNELTKQQANTTLKWIEENRQLTIDFKQSSI